MTRKLYAVGDIHGCYETLKALLTKVDADRDGAPAKVVFLGDYIDRGPLSSHVIDHMIRLQGHPPEGVEFVFLRGNHEEFMLDPYAAGMWFHNGGKQTLDSYVWGGDTDHDWIKKHTYWIQENTVYTHRDGRFLFVHAGINPERSLDKQSEETMVWNRDFNDYDGKFPEDVFVVHGHTPVPSPQLNRNQVNIDTGCVFHRGFSENYGKLTAAVLHEGEIRFIQQVNCESKLL